MLRPNSGQILEHAGTQFPARGQPYGLIRQAGQKDIHDADGGAHIKIQILGHIADNRLPCAPSVSRRIMEISLVGNLTQDGLKQGALAGTVGANQSRQLAAMQMQIHILKNGQAAHLDTEIFDFRAAELGTVAA